MNIKIITPTWKTRNSWYSKMVGEILKVKKQENSYFLIDKEVERLKLNKKYIYFIEMEDAEVVDAKKVMVKNSWDNVESKLRRKFSPDKYGTTFFSVDIDDLMKTIKRYCEIKIKEDGNTQP